MRGVEVAFRSHLLQVANVMIMQTSMNRNINASEAISRYSTNGKDDDVQGFE